PFAVELAKVTLTIAKKVAIDKLSLTEQELPLDTLDQNIVCDDALFSPWVKADAIIGNPPFLGGKHMRLNLGDEYVDRVFKKFSKVKDVDFCSYWFRLAHDNINENGRIGLVGTNSISQGKSRKASLDYVTNNGGQIHEAISTQPWSGEAKVHVSIVNWHYQQPNKYFLDNEEVNFINSSLQPRIDVSKSLKLQSNKNKSFQGVIPNGKGFVITEKEAKKWIAKDQQNNKILKPFSMGTNLAQIPHGKPDRWIIDFDDMTLEDASNFKESFERVKSTIPVEIKNNKNTKLKQYWWKYEGKRIAMRKAISSLSYYFAVPRVSKWAIFIPVSSNWLSGDLNVVVASEDYYILGILTSSIHRAWLIEGDKSTLKSDIRYNKTNHFETFPFPQSVNKKIVQQIRSKMTELHEYRTQQMEQKQWGITQLYNEYFHEPASKLYKLHRELDKLVMKAYAFKANDDILAKLLDLNLELADKEERGEQVIGATSPIKQTCLV
ncbi:MAG: DNA methyltransferase, partial [Cyanobacteria bacterium J06558_2]